MQQTENYRFRIKRVYEPPDKHNGRRILVDRLWPRGLTKEKASIDLWLKDIAPSTELRKWFGHNPDRWEEFKERYLAELKGNSDQIQLSMMPAEIVCASGWGVTRDVFYDSRQIAILPMGLCFPARVNPVTFRHGLNARGHDTINSSIICAILKLRWLLGSMHRHIK